MSGDLLENDSLLQLQGSSVTYRIAVGPQRGQKVFMLQTVPASPEKEKSKDLVGKVEGFSLHAGVAARSNERDKLERLCRYITRPAVSTKRLSLTSRGKVCYELKTAYKDGTPHVIFEPLDFIARLAALVPKPRVNLTRFHGVFAPNSPYRRLIIPKLAEKASSCGDDANDESQRVSKRRAKMTWAQRLKRVFDIEISDCQHCGGQVKIIACITERETIDKILVHIMKKETQAVGNQSFARAPPQFYLFGKI